MMGYRPTPSRPQVWAVEDTSVQLTWGDLPAGSVTATAGASSVALDHRGGPGALDLSGLPPGSPAAIELTWPGGRAHLTAATLPPPPGRLLGRFATISDLHLGAGRWGVLKQMNDSKVPFAVRSGEPHPYRCAHAAVAEAVRWGAELLIIKGDGVHHEVPADFAALARLIDAFPSLPMLLIPGNHEFDGDCRPPATVGSRDLAYVRSVEWVDRSGIRIMVADTTVPGARRGSVDRVEDAIVDGVTSAPGPVFLAIHHQLQPGRLPRYWPIGVPAPRSIEFLDRLDALDRPVLVSSGHTHRNRRHRHGGLTMTEVASTKDWPGVWAGYAVYEGGIRQVVRRIADPDSMAWTEYSRGAVGGLWARWAPGPLDQRCLSLPWQQPPHTPSTATQTNARRL